MIDIQVKYKMNTCIKIIIKSVWCQFVLNMDFSRGEIQMLCLNLKR